MAEEEARAISARTTAARAAAKVGGTKLGCWRGGPVVDGTLGVDAVRKTADAFAAGVAPMLRQMQSEGQCLSQMAARLAEKGIKTPRVGTWTAAGVRNCRNRS